MQDRSREGRRGERGFALVLAILSLMLLTFLGLTMATTTSTELQIATNYRWSQQALYNAEAGLEAARIVLASADATSQWAPYLPTLRPGTWAQGSAPAPLDAVVGRDFYRSDCDDRAGVGFGRILTDVDRLENLSDFGGQSLNGAFSVWVRRPLVVDNGGMYSDDPRNDVLVIVSEGVAPYRGVGGAMDALVASRQAVRVLETRYALGLSTTGDPCGSKQQGQEGGSPMGENFNPCAMVTAGAGGSLAPVFGGSGAGELTTIGGVQ